MDKQRLEDHLNVLSAHPGIHWVEEQEEEILQELMSQGLLLYSCSVYSFELSRWYVTKFVHTETRALLQLTDLVTKTLRRVFLEGDLVTVSFRAPELWGNPIELTGVLISLIIRDKLGPDMANSNVWEFKPFGCDLSYYVKEESIYAITPNKPLSHRFRIPGPLGTLKCLDPVSSCEKANEQTKT